ncbi:MAG: helix-turn-helix domain-containing protein [Candidatus Margulisbacteria bacterium]|jgi:transcriptional regulator with XRE-family HTH domain|nr:helix-turn-helix domain-containing protein [Candidatus Margulisiibacteriota bacterium]
MLKDEVSESRALSILGANVKQFRERLELSQAELAEKADISITFLSDVERGKKWISLYTMLKLANIFQVEIYELLKPLTGWPADSVHLLGKYHEDINHALTRIHSKYLYQCSGRRPRR